MHVREKERVGLQPLVGAEEKFNLGRLGDPSIAKQLS